MDRKSFYDLIAEIEASGGETDKMKELLQKLRDDFDEREGELNRYREKRDKETPGTEKETRKIEEESKEDNREDGGERRDPIDYKNAYEEMKKELVDRLMGYRESKEEEKEEEEKRRIADLFK